MTFFRCCEVVPGALVGTYVGVILNSILPGWAWLLDSDIIEAAMLKLIRIFVGFGSSL